VCERESEREREIEREQERESARTRVRLCLRAFMSVPERPWWIGTLLTINYKLHNICYLLAQRERERERESCGVGVYGVYEVGWGGGAARAHRREASDLIIIQNFVVLRVKELLPRKGTCASFQRACLRMCTLNPKPRRPNP
jgi:hypothetical protein